MTTPEQKKNKLPRGYTRVKTVGDIVACDILIDRKNGKFAVMPILGDQGITSFHESLVQAETQIIAMQKQNMVEVLYFHGHYTDRFPHIYIGKFRFINGEWYGNDGRRISRDVKLLVPNPDLVGAFKSLEEEYKKAQQRVADIRKSAIDLANMSLKMEPPQE